jgi:VWFA-related protein
LRSVGGGAAFAFVLALAAQTPRPDVFTIRDNVELVILDVAVQDARGAFARNLQRQNFRVWEDGRPRDISHFSAEDVPVTVGLVVDNSASMIRKRAEVITAGLAFTRESNPRDRFFVVNFNDSVIPGLPNSLRFTDDPSTLRSALYVGKPQGKTALYDAIVYGIRHLELSGEEKRTLVIVSDGGDNASHTSSPELMKTIEASRATIYTIGLYDADSGDLRPGVLRKIARVSGGQYFEPKQMADVLPAFQAISADIRHRYTIGFVPGRYEKARVVRSLKVMAEVDGRKLKVRTRASYSAGPPEYFGDKGDKAGGEIR